jgi:hypothetical protein
MLKYRQQAVMEKTLDDMQEIVRTCGSFQTLHILFMSPHPGREKPMI